MTEIHEDYGPSYPYSDHKCGDHVTYRVDGLEEQGEILWVSASHTLPSGRNMPPHYWIVRDGGGFPDAILFGDLVIVEEPAMPKCPYCFGSHYNVEQCPLNPNRHM
jgi:hypothetical protein